ncbi:putative AP2/B3-like transcriptional factor family protein [Hibiscus syriacus]|uniref:AP2/B3-like transcriptional factor family protein n=1 Tax=Hibiscus syriacus TaxID=106335 RepID=A0A6A3A7M6_HIBSY|nr:late embryogenesis abundant protein D-7-like [Hibiscus syriacus]KAE8699132.1 putative AP2/B3-like transcriptional factor family protein [Hibiscus syriacus]
MAASLIAKTAMFQLSKAFPKTLSLRPSIKVSRICLSTAASKRPEGRDAYESANPRAEFAYRVDTSSDEDYAHDAKEKTEETAGMASDKANEMTDRAAETSRSANETMRQKANEYAQDTKEIAQSARDKAKEGTEKASQTAHEWKEKSKEGAHGVTEKTEEVAGTVVGKAKQTAQGAWDAAKGTGQKIKETVVGKNKEGKMDEDVVDLRRRVELEGDERKY